MFRKYETSSLILFTPRNSRLPGLSVSPELPAKKAQPPRSIFHLRGGVIYSPLSLSNAAADTCHISSSIFFLKDLSRVPSARTAFSLTSMIHFP